MERLKEEVKNNEGKLLNAKTEISKLLIDLEYEKEETLYGIKISKSKLIKLEILSIQIEKIIRSIL